MKKEYIKPQIENHAVKTPFLLAGSEPVGGGDTEQQRSKSDFGFDEEE